MEEEYHNVNRAMDRLFEIQDRHMASFSDDETPPDDLEHQSTERKEAVNRLQKEVDTFTVKAQENGGSEAREMMQFFNNRISTLLEQNRTIESRVQAVKDRIGNSMKQVKKGKRGIQSYNASPSVRNRPRAINFSE